MDSPTSCECDFRQLHLNMIERSQRLALLPENTEEMPACCSVANCTSGHNVCGHLFDEHPTRWDLRQRHNLLRHYKEAKSALRRIRR